jgi:hypothetical protein
MVRETVDLDAVPLDGEEGTRDDHKCSSHSEGGKERVV